jgi:hypothetical protein
MNISEIEAQARDIWNAITSLHQEMSELSKNKPDDVVNTFKLKVINSLLDRVRQIVGDDPLLKPIEPFTEDLSPVNSDVVITLGQFGAALRNYRINVLSHGTDSF